MPLPSFLQRKPEPAAKRRGDDGTGAVEAARTQARRRLIGAVVLLAVGVVVFPLVFESQPRPVAVNVPIEVPARKDAGAVAAARKPTAPAPSDEAPVDAAPPAPAPMASAVATAPEVKPTPAPAAPASKAVAKAPEKVPEKAAEKPAEKAPEKAVAKAEESDRAKALLEGKAAAATSKEGRFVVQVGAFSDAGALRDARQKVERLGLKTYTQVVETDAGKRTRVRVGPFATREEADSAAAKLKSAALPAAVLTL